MKILHIIFYILFLSNYLLGQEIKTTSSFDTYSIEEKTIPVSWEFTRKPIILYDDNKNNTLDALETIKIRFKVKNLGPGDGNNLSLKIDPEFHNLNNEYFTLDEFGIEDLNLNKKIKNVKAGEEQDIIFSIRSNKQLFSGTIDLAISIIEPNGFGTKDPCAISINTKEYIPPQLTITEAVCTCESDYMQENERCNIKIKFKNEGEGKAQNLKLLISESEFINFYSGESNPVSEFDELLPTKEDSLSIGFMVSSNNNGNDLTFDIKISETFNEYGSEKSLIIPIGTNLETEESKLRRKKELEQQKIIEEEKRMQAQLLKEEIERLNNLCGESIQLLTGNWSSAFDYHGEIAMNVSIQFYEVNQYINFKIINNIFYGSNPRDINFDSPDKVFNHEFRVLDCKTINSKTTIYGKDLTNNKNVSLTFSIISANKYKFIFDGISQKNTGEPSTDILELNSNGKYENLFMKK